MKVEELKKLMNKSTAVLIMDNGDPSFVAISYETYKDLVLKNDIGDEVKVKSDKTVPIKKETESEIDVPKSVQEPSRQFGENELEMLDRINKEILALKEEILKEEKLLTIDPV
jgi:PHD/YefM family antitoxin component YafN of YafNO toxin-antitoxin module